MAQVLLRNVDGYKVIAQRSARSPALRVIRLFLTAVEGSLLDRVDLVFEPSPPDRGRIESTFAVLNLPTEDYGDYVHLLQTESPIFVSVVTDARDRVIAGSLGTDPETPGEGFEDADSSSG